MKILKGLAKYFDFTLSTPDKKDADDRLNGILTQGDNSVDITELKKIFSERNIDAKQLRKEAWERKR